MNRRPQAEVGRVRLLSRVVGVEQVDDARGKLGPGSLGKIVHF